MKEGKKKKINEIIKDFRGYIAIKDRYMLNFKWD